MASTSPDSTCRTDPGPDRTHRGRSSDPLRGAPRAGLHIGGGTHASTTHGSSICRRGGSGAGPPSAEPQLHFQTSATPVATNRSQAHFPNNAQARVTHHLQQPFRQGNGHMVLRGRALTMHTRIRRGPLRRNQPRSGVPTRSDHLGLLQGILHGREGHRLRLSGASQHRSVRRRLS